MLLGKSFLCAGLVLTSGAFLIAAGTPAAPASPATQPTETKPKRAQKLTEPWSLLKTLTPDQVTQIEKIHSDSHEQIDKIEAKEKDDITALLTPDQVTELKVDEAKQKSERKGRSAERKKEATTEPAK
jgi:Spy/CpxP family protein refolding chaperone